MGRLLIAASILIAIAVLTAATAVSQGHKRAAFHVCDLVETHYYRSQEEYVQDWLERCRARAMSQGFWAGREDAIRAINVSLQDLGVSHLFLYTPVENRELWEHEAVDTGLRTRNIEGRYVVFDVLEGSAGQAAGVKRGDIVISINGYDVGNEDEIKGSSGTFEIRRGARRFPIEIVAVPLTADLRPKVIVLSPGVAVLKVESLLARYFDREEWAPQAQSLAEQDHVILDLRGNAGGSFPAMVRVASAFFCERTRLGSLFKPSSSSVDEDDLVDDLAADSQIDQLNEVARLHLTTFADYPCFDGRATVLVDSGTSSVAEILAESFFHRRRSRVWGMPTAGQVVMAQWFSVPALGGGDYSISIPIAGYWTRKGEEIEAEGLSPERLLYYDLETAVRGRDSWIDRAVSTQVR